MICDSVCFVRTLRPGIVHTGDDNQGLVIKYPTRFILCTYIHTNYTGIIRD